MDAKGDSIVDTATSSQKYYLLMKRTIQFLVPFSLCSFLVSYFSGFQVFFSYDLEFSTLFFPLFALDRKYMFLICNGILAFLAKNLRITSSGSDYGALVTSSTEDGVQQITELPQNLEEASVQENVESMEYENSPQNVPIQQKIQLEEDQDCEGFHEGAAKDQVKTEGSVLVESEDWEEEEDEDYESRVIVGNTSSVVEDINDAIVSTEELNKKFEEFIRKMKEEIRIEAQQALITV